MLNEILLSPTIRMMTYGLIAVATLIPALVISSVVRLNKGAGVNGPLILVAVGFVLGAIAAAMTALGYYGQETFGAWCPIIALLAQLIMLTGLAWWRAIVKSLIK